MGIALGQVIQVEVLDTCITGNRGGLGRRHMTRIGSEGRIDVQEGGFGNQAVGISCAGAELGEIHGVADIHQLFPGSFRAQHVVGMNRCPMSALNTFARQQAPPFRTHRHAETRSRFGQERAPGLFLKREAIRGFDMVTGAKGVARIRR